MMFDWDKFLNRNFKIVVHCKTLKEAKDFCQQMHNNDLKWCDNRTYLELNNWNSYKEDTCYTNDGCYCHIGYFKRERNWTILEYSDFFDTDSVETVEEFLLRIGRKDVSYDDI